MTDKNITPQPEQNPAANPLQPNQCTEKMEVWTRIVGYYRPTNNWNPGKSEEYGFRKHFKIEKKEEK